MEVTEYPYIYIYPFDMLGKSNLKRGPNNRQTNEKSKPRSSPFPGKKKRKEKKIENANGWGKLGGKTIGRMGNRGGENGGGVRQSQWQTVLLINRNRGARKFS